MRYIKKVIFGWLILAVLQSGCRVLLVAEQEHIDIMQVLETYDLVKVCMVLGLAGATYTIVVSIVIIGFLYALVVILWELMRWICEKEE